MKKTFGKLIVVGLFALPILLAACGKKEEPPGAGAVNGGSSAGPKADSDRGSAGRTRGEGEGGK